MKTTILILALFITPMTLSANYVVDFSNPMTYQTTCGSVQPSQWSVSGQTCELLLPPLKATTDSVITVNYLFRINQSGNLYKWDNLSLMYKMGINGTWQTDTTITGQLNNNVRDIAGSFILSKGDTLHFKVVAYTRSTSGFWAVKTGDISISGVTPVYFPLPVELLDFSGIHNETRQSNLLSWSTASETNNAKFVVERSEDGTTYEILQTLPGAGNSNILLTYEYEDFGIEKDYYYRLTQIDYDGQYEIFSPLFIEQFSETSSNSMIENVWMNGDLIYFTLNSKLDQPVFVSLHDVSGSIIHESLINPEEIESSVEYYGNKGAMLLLVIKDSNGNSETRKLITL
ncbi:MAG: hypothetical protein A2W93_06980 [Bacteroidetes bacterium GWF2_43_63]|nr:MAG: hypothetical protein A2W94_09900 [Bacteroidetes bacterium GWE2_42_42]OFY53757.1 MAG: hypothetical protein A2W93_06980 [Bacteroidetes bacterium GWF2_43_63]HCB61039.1 hypothetical protein [Bacteroidales bacterium]HCY24161.1 hypothetical protein [Bacteroidales bacterium]